MKKSDRDDRKKILNEFFVGGNWFPVHRDLILAFNAQDCLMISYMFNLFGYWSKPSSRKSKKIQEFEARLGEGWFYCKANHVMEHLNLTHRQHEKIMKRLKGIGIVETRLIGIPTHRMVKLDQEKIYEMAVEARRRFRFVQKEDDSTFTSETGFLP
jgi:hypothetical protein